MRFFAILTAAAIASAHAAEPRVAILGDSITYGGRWPTLVESALRSTPQFARAEIVNFGLSSETVSGLSEQGHAGGKFPRPCLHERLTRILDGYKPTHVLACYGMNDGIYMPLDEGRQKAFQDGIIRLKDQVEARGAKIALITAPLFDGDHPDEAANGYDAVLDAQAAWLISQKGWQVIDIRTDLRRSVAEAKRSDPGFIYAKDKVHPGAQGHDFIAASVMRQLWPIWQLPGNPAPANAKALAILGKRGDLLKHAWLKKTGHLRPGVPDGVPLDEAEAQAAALLKDYLNAVEKPDPAAKDHVLMIAIDDLNDWIACMSNKESGLGHPQASTPHLDTLAKRGVLFTNAHCQAPICRPSRNSFLSGLRPSTTGVYGNDSAYDAKGTLSGGADVPWLPLRFQQAGYQTFAVGKLHHTGSKGLAGTLGPQTDQGPYPKRKMNVPEEIVKQGIWDYGAWPEEERFTDRRMASWVSGQIGKPIAKGDAPRFISLGFYRPHVPLFAPKKWFDAAPKPADVVLAPVRADDLDDLPPISRRISRRVSFPKPIDWVMENEARMRDFTQAYLACTSAMDDCLGQVIAALDHSGMAENTWIVVFSDHGFHLGEKRHVTKQTLWERSTHVPLIVVPPKRISDTPRGVRCGRPVELIDVYPTLLAATGLDPVPADKHLDGLSLLPWIVDPEAPRERPAMTTLYSGNHTLRDERYRYTRYADGSEELYDHSADPNEYENLIALTRERPELQDAVRRLSEWIPKIQAGEPDLISP